MEILKALVDLVDVLDLEPSDSELSIEFFDRAVQTGLEQGLISDNEAAPLVAYLEEQAP